MIKESTAWLLTNAMEDVVTKGTGTACQLDNMTVAGKTGTTDDYNDLWFVGYTPYYTCAVWSGFDNNEKLPNDYSREFHKGLWRKVMNRIHEGLADQEFTMPSSIEKLSVCAETGLLPRAGCPVITEYFDIGDVPDEYCDNHFYEPEPIPEYTEDTYYEEPSTDTETTTDTDNPDGETPAPEDPGTEDPGTGDPGTGDPGTDGDGTGGDGSGDGDWDYVDPGTGGGTSGGGDWDYVDPGTGGDVPVA